MKRVIFITINLLLHGCGIISEQSIYEGIRNQQKNKDVGVEPKSQPLPPYDQYQEERERQSRQ